MVALERKRPAFLRAAAVIALILASMFVLARPAYALPTLIAAVASIPIGYLISTVVSVFLIDAIAQFLVPLAEVMFEWTTDYTTIPYVNTVILALQALAVVAVVAIRIGVGISSGILLKGGNREASIGEYLYRSIIAVVMVALMPMLCRTVIDFGIMLYNGITDGGGALSDKLEWFDCSNVDLTTATEITPSIMWALVGIVLMLVLCFAVGYQFMRRQVEMLTVSLIAPIVSVLSATENDSDQPIDLLKRLFGMCCTQWIQYILCMIALDVGAAWVAAAMGTGWLGDSAGSVFSGENTELFLLSIAAFAAALTVPSLVDQYTFGNGGSRVGGIVTATVVGGALRSVSPAKASASVVRAARK